MITGATVVLKTIPCSFMSRYVCPVLVSFLAISATLIVTVSILYWNYSETMCVFIVSVFKKLALIVFILIVFILTISYFTGTSELPSPCHLLVNNFICPRYPGTQVPGTRYLAGLHKLWYPGIRDMSTWSKFGAHGEHGDVFLFSNLGALWFSENLIRH